MDGLFAWLTKQHPPFKCKGGTGLLLTSEVRKESLSTDAVVNVEHKPLTDDEVEAWASKAPHLTAYLGIVWLPIVASASGKKDDLDPWSIQVNEERLNILLAAFRVQLAYRYGFTPAQGYALLHEGVETNDRSPSYCIFRRNSFIVAWAPVPNGQSKRAVIVCHDDSIVVLQEVIFHQRKLASHPLFLAMVVAMWYGNYIGRFLTGLENSITQVENRTGHHSWSLELYGTADGDFPSLSARMSGVSTNLAVLTSQVRLLAGMLLWIADLESKLAQRPADFMPCIHMVRARLDQQETHLAFLRDRVNNQMTALFNLITSQDARTGIEVARDSKTLAVASKLDSSSMKTLAAVSVVFLPGTFVASFFSMPLFDFQNNSMAVSNKFWVYWIVTVPLTAFTVMVWYLWIRRKQVLLDRANRPDNDNEAGLKMQ